MVITNKSSHIKEVAKVFLSMVTGNKPSLGASRVMGTATAVATGGAYVSTLQKRQHYAIYLVNLETNQIEWVKTGIV
ncbi:MULTISPECIES: hypothetical protein [Psychrobacter]|uniref:hypothetical protein n=1 Tax=Psychrobacter TaxID=497 RepID=UPI0019188D6A|nr:MULTISPECIES: hypothetical protein [Psychrobacter]